MEELRTKKKPQSNKGRPKCRDWIKTEDLHYPTHEKAEPNQSIKDLRRKIETQNRNTEEIERKQNLNSTMILVIGKTERTESSIHAVQAIHIAFALVRVSMQLALNKEALVKQGFQPWRPPVILFIRTPSTLLGIQQNKKKEKKRTLN